MSTRRPIHLALVALALALGLPGAASADSRVTARIDGPSTVQRGQETTYTVTIRNAGKQTLGAGSPRVSLDLDALPSSGASLAAPVQVGGVGPWSCRTSGCTLASGARLAPGDTASFAVATKVFASHTLDLDVSGNEVAFSRVRKSVRTSGTLRPVVYGLALPASFSPRTPPIGFTLSEPARVTVSLERVTARYRLGRKVRTRRGFRRVVSTRCADRRPRVRRSTRVRKLRSRCSVGTRTAYVLLRGRRGFNQVDVALLRQLRPGRRYRVRLAIRTPDGRTGREAITPVLPATG